MILREAGLLIFLVLTGMLLLRAQHPFQEVQEVELLSCEDLLLENLVIIRNVKTGDIDVVPSTTVREKVN